MIHRLRSTLMIGLLLAMTGVNPARAAEINAFARDLAQQLGFDKRDLEGLEDGKVLTRRFHKEGAKELAVALVALLPTTVPRTIARFEGNDLLEADKTILAWGALEGPVTVASFAKLELPAKELEKLAGDDVDDDFNLSEQELALLAERKAAAKSKAERSKSAMEAYREILVGRVKAYQSRGLSGIAPYRHGRNDSLPGADLKGALPPQDGVIAKETPAFAQWLREYPSGGKAASSKFVWLLQELNGRPTVILAHRAANEGSHVLFLVQRDFFVGHTFDALQILIGVVPAGENEAVLFYVNTTFTEQVTGFGSSAAHGIGRKIMTGEILELFEAVKTDLSSGK
jgi:hypothetical protein